MSDKKKILVIHYNLALGGAESSLLGLLDTIDYSRYEVDLFLLSHDGELLDKVNENVHLLPEVKAYAALTKPILSNFKEVLWQIGLVRCYAKLVSKLTKGPLHVAHNYKQYFHKLSMPFLPRIPGQYDLAISFNDPHYIVSKKVNATVKMGWFHTDAANIVFSDRIEKEMWHGLDYAVNVSDKCKTAFDLKHPYLVNQSIVIENILSKALVLRQSMAFSVKHEMPNDESFKILSVGRFCDAKNFDNIPDICRRILDSRINVKWYIIGYGGDEPLIRQRIAEAGMERHVIILDKKANPYPYINACDLYVQPSRYEGKCVSVREAQLLGKPVVITRYATSASQLEDGVDGVIVPMDNAGCAAAITELLRNKDKQAALSFACMQRDYTNSEEIEKIYDILE